MPVQLFPNWVVKLMRNPQLRTQHWFHRPVEVFHVSPKMTKFEIKEYLIKMYNMPVSHVHTSIMTGKTRTSREYGTKSKEADYKKAYVYLHDSQETTNRIRYHPIEFQNTPEARAAWPSMPHRLVPKSIPAKKHRPDDFDLDTFLPARDRNAARQKPLNYRPIDNRFPDDLLDDD